MKRNPLTLNNNQRETSLLKNLIKRTEFKFPQIKKKWTNSFFEKQLLIF